MCHYISRFCCYRCRMSEAGIHSWLLQCVIRALVGFGGTGYRTPADSECGERDDAGACGCRHAATGGTAGSTLGGAGGWWFTRAVLGFVQVVSLVTRPSEMFSFGQQSSMPSSRSMVCVGGGGGRGGFSGIEGAVTGLGGEYIYADRVEIYVLSRMDDQFRKGGIVTCGRGWGGRGFGPRPAGRAWTYAMIPACCRVGLLSRLMTRWLFFTSGVAAIA